MIIHNTKKYKEPVPAVIWSIHPLSQIITIRPAWDPYTKLILEKELDEYWSYGHMLSLAKILKQSGFYPYKAKYLNVVRRNLAFFRQGYFVYPGENIIVDPWYFDGDKPAAINYYNPFHEYDEQPKFYGRK